MLDRELSVKGCNENLNAVNTVFFKGWNWGVANFNGSVLNFEVSEHLRYSFASIFF